MRYSDVTYEELLSIAVTMPEVAEHVGGRELSLNRNGGWMLTLKRDGETVVFKLDWSDHDRFLVAHPEIFFKTPHYEGFPAILTRLTTLTPPLAHEVLQASWLDAPNKALKKPA